MPAEQNSLRAAVDRILGFSPGGPSSAAGGGAGAGAGGGAGGATALGAGGGTGATALGAGAPSGAEEVIAPIYSQVTKRPFSNITGATSQSSLFDPFAEVNAELSALKQKNAALSTAATPTATATAPAKTPAPVSVVSSTSTTPAYKWTPTGGANMQNQYLGYYNQNIWNQPGLNTPKAGQVEGGAAQGLFYNPTGTKGGFQVMSSEALRNPTVYGNVRTMARDPVADKAWYDMLAQSPVRY
jgi:hypothetical protein